MIANPVRGEAAIPVAGETVVPRPSFEALVAAEQELGPLFALVERAAEGRLGLAEMAGLFWHCAGGVVARERLGAAVEVELLHPGMSLHNASDEALVAGANLALLGEELLQFGRAQPLGADRYLLSRLLRGRRGTEWAMAGHSAGDPFTLIEVAALAAIEAPSGSLGGEARLSASGIGDIIPATADILIEGRSLLPPSPAHLIVIRLSNGDVVISWVRRSRLGWGWTSGADTPLGEETESYRLDIAGAGFAREAAPGAPSFLYDAAMQAGDGASGALTITVRQIGTYGASRPASIILP